ncbi:MAG: carbonic anhydrase [Calditerrivibrio sp.]|nr:carbonic anhydrase [Calditerrivibrio sp.]MCA1931956.1 carbonic anhydrase [Calditerrivibrio sp.]
MDKLFKGVIDFRESEFDRYKDIFSRLSDKQSPHTLFVGCSDSRIVPNLITNTDPGELFIIRNIANSVPPYRDSDDVLATTSAIEYAVQVLNVKTIVVCGHSNCGGCAALKKIDKLDHLPHVKRWVSSLMPVYEYVVDLMKDKNESDEYHEEWYFEQANIVYQMKNLLTYPYISEKYNRGEITVLGWYYIIETGEVYNYNPITTKFELIK